MKNLIGLYVNLDSAKVLEFNTTNSIIIDQLEYNKLRQRYEVRDRGTINWYPIEWVVSVNEYIWNGLCWDIIIKPIDLSNLM